MFRVYQVRFSASDRRYRGQIVCGGGGSNHHHHHFFPSVPCSPLHLPGPAGAGGMPPLLGPVNYQSYVDTAQQLDAVAVRKSLSRPPAAGVGAAPPDPADGKGDGPDAAAAEGVPDGEGAAVGLAGLAEGEARSDAGGEAELTWIDWAWPGSHTPCPFNSRHPADQLSTRAHRLPFLSPGVLRSCPLLQTAALRISGLPCYTKLTRSLRVLTYRVKAAVRRREMVSVAVDVKELPAAYVFVADMPSLKNTDIKVQVENDNLLKISGERKREEFPTDQEIKYVHVERTAGKFMRKFNLPANANLDNIKAACQDGLLSIWVPKNPPPDPHRPRTFDVPVSSANLQTDQ